MSVDLAFVIPVYQDQAGAEKTLESLRQASWPVVGAIVLVDDGSNPALAIRPTEWAPLRVELVRLSENQGIEGALNAGLARARQLEAKYIARVDAKDTIRGDRLTKQIGIMETRPRVGIVTSDINFVDSAGRQLFRFVGPRTDGEARRRMHINSCLGHTGSMLRARFLDEVGHYSMDYPAAEDYDLFFRLLAVSEAWCVPEPLTTSVIGEGGISKTRRRDQLKSRLRIQLNYFDAMEVASYAGIALTLAMFLIPQRWIQLAKRMLRNSPI